MCSFKPGDIVVCLNRFSGWPGFVDNMTKYLNTPLTVIGEYRSFGLIGIKVKEDYGKYLWNAESLSFYNLGQYEEKKKQQRVEKINTLYMRQAWVIEGKKSALFYTKQAARNAKNLVMTEKGTILPSTQMVTPTVLDAHS